MTPLRDWLEWIWTNRSSGLILTSLTTVLVAYLFYRVPSPGVSVALMGGVAAALSLRTKATGTEKGVWMLLMFAFLVVEFGAIRKDRWLNEQDVRKRVEEERQHFSAIADGIQQSIAQNDADFKATMSRSDRLMTLEHKAVVGLGENMKTATGGDSYCWTDMSPANPPTVVCSGKYPLYEVSMRVTDLNLMAATKDIFRSDVLVSDLGNRPPNTAQILPNRVPFTGTDKQDYNVFFGARNGFWTELIRYKKVNGQWTVARLVESSLNARYPKGAVVYEVVDKAFPLADLQSDNDWQNAQKLPRLTR